MKNKGEEMLKSKLKRLEKRFTEFPELLGFSGGVSMNNILLAQKEAGLCFPVSYQWFLLTFGMGSFGDFEIFGLSETEDGKLKRESTLPDVMFALKLLRQNKGLPKEYLPFCGDGFGGYYFIRAVPENHEDSCIYFGDMKVGQMELVPLSITFADFLSKRVQEIAEQNVGERFWEYGWKDKG